MKSIIIIFLTIISIYSVKSQSFNENWKFDLKYLKDSLPKKHINLFFKIDSNKFNNHIDSLIKNIDSIPHDYLILSLQELFAKIGDSHTSFVWKNMLSDFKFLPIKFEWFSDNIYITKTSEEYESLLGSKLISVNNVIVKNIINKFQGLVVADNEAMIKINIPALLNTGVLYDYYKITKHCDSLLITAQNSEGKIISLNVALRTTKIKKIKSIELKGTALYLSNFKKKFWYKVLPTDSLIYIQYNECLGKEVFKDYKKLFKPQLKKYPFLTRTLILLDMNMNILFSHSFDKFAKNIYRELSRGKYRKLIFDIRHNTGGSSLQGSNLIDSIATFSHLKLYGIIGEKTFSGGVFAAIDLLRNNAVLVGESTSGMAKCFGEVRVFILPKTFNEIHYSTKYFDISNKYTNTILPDIKLDITFDDYLKGFDPCFEYVKNIK